MRSSGRPGAAPDVDGLVVVEVDRGPDALRVEAVAALGDRLGGQLPRQRDGLLLEVVAEGEVAVHLEERAVAAGLADLVDVRGADALLHADRALERRGLLAQEVRHELHHAGVDEQQVRVVDRRQRRARHHGVPVGLEVRQEPSLDFRGPHRVRHSPSSCCLNWRTGRRRPCAHGRSRRIQRYPLVEVRRGCSSSRSAMPSRTSSRKPRTDPATPDSDSWAWPASPAGENGAGLLGDRAHHHDTDADADAQPQQPPEHGSAPPHALARLQLVTHRLLLVGLALVAGGPAQRRR